MGTPTTRCENRKNRILSTDRGIKIIARTIYVKLKANNFSREDTLKLINEIIALLTNDIKNKII